MTYFRKDMAQEQLLGEFLDDIYRKIGLRFSRITDYNDQHKGKDVVITHHEKMYIVDEKAQLHYLNKNLPTFTFELSYLKKGAWRQGWLFDRDKLTDYYFLITGIETQNQCIPTEKADFLTCKITSIHRRKLIELLEKRGLTEERLKTYAADLRQQNKGGKTALEELDPKKEGCLFFTTQLAEKPINLQLRLAFLIKEGVGKRIFPQ